MGLFITAAQAAGDAAAHAELEAMEHGSSGLPQLDLNTFPSQIFWLIVTLVVLYVMFTKIALPKIGGMIEERHDTIEDDLDRATEFKRKAVEAEKAYDAALVAARAKAQEIANATRADIQKELDAATAEADKQIAAKAAESEAKLAEIRAGAMAAVEEVALETAQALVAKLSPVEADDAAVKAAVNAKLEG